ncbi:MAG: C25 family cysteine peptidase, partial [Acidobacteria bacterium]|nr:C25 family cysteine peptidase [Acidobacteriota bacterium]
VTLLPTNQLRDTTNEADYLIIAHPSLIDATPGSAYSQFVDYLSTVRGLTVKLVYIQDIYDAFSDSIENPEAIRSFLAYAHANWVGPSGTAPPPAYLLLVGDAVWDPKNNLNRVDWVDLVPTVIMFYDQSILKFYSADTWLASYLGADHSPDILHGRIPVRTLSQANAVFAKILAYSQSPPIGAWRADGYFLADVGNEDVETQIFEGEEDVIAAHFTSPWTQTKQYYAQPPYNAPVGGNGPVAQFKADFVSHWNGSHPAVASFSGHGAFDILGNDLFFRPADVSLLTNGAYQPFFYNSDCLTGGFHAVGVDSMAEAFLQSSTGGAIGYFAPAGLSFTFFASTVSGQLFADLFGAEKFRELGTLTERARGALFQQGAIADGQGFAFVGEPSLQLVLPAPQPPSSFSVTAGNSVVDLAWTPSPDPNSVGTNLYRTQNTQLPYVKINGSPVTGTFFSDTTVSNGSTYFYRAVSVDAAGFEGAVTNTNADCGVAGPPDGPQCRRAQPKNLVPPIAPQGVKVRDTGIGTILEVSWLANPESDIQRYVVAYGTTQGSHPLTINAGLATQIFLSGLTTGTPYFVIVYAVNTSGIQGADSLEVSAAPHIFAGVAPPATIKTLMLDRSANDVILTWSAVTLDIYGNQTVVDHYNVYRGNFPDFTPSDGFNLLGQVPASSSPSFTHTGGAVTPDNGFYLVSAVDTNGLSSGLGADLPAGIVALDVQPASTPGMIRLSWPAASLTVTGQPARISHYKLHGATTPVPRFVVTAGNLIQDNITGTFVEIPTPADARYYYNVIVVDARGNLSPY